METRKSIGERMLERLDRSNRFGRFARLDSGSRLGAYWFPDDVHALSQRDHRQDMTHISSAPYWERIHRLGNARQRRQQRLFSLAERATQKRQITALRRLPDLKKRAAPLFGYVPFGSDSFEVLAPLPVPIEAVDGESTPVASPGSPSAWVGAQRAASPWHTGGDYRTARVADRPAQRPIRHAAERAPLSDGDLASLKRAVPADLTRDVQATESGERRAVARRAGRALRRSAGPTRPVAVDFEAALPDDFLPPTRHAQGRIAPQKGRRRGLRAAISSSPLMAALESEVARGDTVNGPRRAAGRPTGRTIGQTASRRVAHRAQPTDAILLSASPVHAPATVAPSALTSEPQRRAPMQEIPAARDAATSALVVGSSTGPRREAVRPNPAPMVRALDRLDAEPPRLEERPLSARSPVAARPVKTRAGLFAPETTVLLPDVRASEVTDDATPGVATPRAARRSEAATTMQSRFASQGTAVRPALQTDWVATPSRKGEEQPLLTEAPRRKGATVRRRPNRVVRDATGNTFVAESSVLAKVEARAEPGVASTNEPLRSQAGRMSFDGPTESTRLGSALGEQPVVRSNRRMSVADIADASVLNPRLDESTIQQELPQGQHALQRNQRSPVVAETAKNALVQQSKNDLTSSPAGSELLRDVQRKRSVSPRRFRSPLAHVQLRRVQSMPRTAMPGTITLKSTPAQAISNEFDDRGARQSALERVEQAWKRSGRPLDWTSARIEVIQVPMTASDAAEPARAQRSPTGAYIPASTVSVNRRPVPSPAVASGVETGPAATTRTSRAATAQASVPPTVLAAPIRDDVGAADIVSNAPSEEGGSELIGSNLAPRRRTGFDATVSGVGAGHVESTMPIWAQRSTGRPRITGGDDLVQQLARATAPEDVVSVLMDQSDSVRRATSSLPTPVVQVIQQIKTESARAESEAQTARQASAPQAETVRQRSQRREGVRSTTRVVRGMTGLNPRSGTDRSRSAASDRVSKLAKRLQELIAMAENQNRGGARQEVRMAEDSAAARAEGQSAPTDAGDTGDQAADIDTLAREVTEQVTRELEMRRERRQEDPDGRSIWW